MRKIVIILLVINFIIILLMTSVIIGEYKNIGKQFPYLGNTKKESPQDVIKENQIIVTKDKVIIYIDNAEWSKYADSHSMEPLLSSSANGLEIIPICNKIKNGDIIVYASKTINELIVHRVIKIEEDKDGLFFTLKGDNNNVVDPEKVRCSQIKYQVIGIIY